MTGDFEAAVNLYEAALDDSRSAEIHSTRPLFTMISSTRSRERPAMFALKSKRPRMTSNSMRARRDRTTYSVVHDPVWVGGRKI